MKKMNTLIKATTRATTLATSCVRCFFRIAASIASFDGLAFILIAPYYHLMPLNNYAL